MIASLLPDLVLLGLSAEAWFTLAVVAAATVLMILDRGGPDLVLFLALCALVVVGILEPRAAMAGFADPATVTIAVLFVVAQAVQDTGGLALLSSALFGRTESARGALTRLVGTVAGLSAFLNNTPIVAMFVPVATGFARRVGASPGRFLLPLSYAAMLGGTCTLVGTSTNLLVSGLLEQTSQAPLRMFELTWVGVPTALVGMVYLVTLAPKLLPDRDDPFAEAQAKAREYLAEVEVAEDSPLVGRTIADAGLRNLPGLFLVEIRRADGARIQPVAPEDRLRARDHLVFTGIASRIKDLTSMPGLTATGEVPDPGHNLYEVVVSHNSWLVGRNVRGTNFRRRFDAAILAVHRSGERIGGRIGDIVLRPGDTLMLTASPGFQRTWQHARDFYLVSEVPFDGQPRYQRAPLALLALLVMVATPGLFQIGMTVPAMAALIVLLVTRCISPRAARAAVNWPVILLIGSGFGIARALEVTGAAAGIADLVVRGPGALGPLALLASVYVLGTVLSLFVSNAAAAVLLFPVAAGAAQAAGLDVRPFAVALAMAASAAFATPIGYQTNLIVQGPGGYRYLDYVRVGLPLHLLAFGVAIAVIPWVWPLSP